MTDQGNSGRSSVVSVLGIAALLVAGAGAVYWRTHGPAPLPVDPAPAPDMPMAPMAPRAGNGVGAGQAPTVLAGEVGSGMPAAAAAPASGAASGAAAAAGSPQAVADAVPGSESGD